MSSLLRHNADLALMTRENWEEQRKTTFLKKIQLLGHFIETSFVQNREKDMDNIIAIVC